MLRCREETGHDRVETQVFFVDAETDQIAVGFQKTIVNHRVDAL